MRVLAIHSDEASHDSSCCIYDGDSITYFLEERYSGLKHDFKLDYCLFNVLRTNLQFDKIIVGALQNRNVTNLHNFDQSKIQKIVDNFSILGKEQRTTANIFVGVDINNMEEKISEIVTNNKYMNISLPEEIEFDKKTKEEWKKFTPTVKKFILNYYKKYKHFPEIKFDTAHHITHAAISFYNSGFDESIVFVADGSGESVLTTSSSENLFHYSESESLFVVNYPSSIKPIYKNFGCAPGYDFSKEIEHYKKINPDCEVHFGHFMSLGWLYGSASLLIRENQDEAGKIMGLSSYGNSTGNNYIVNDYFVNHDLFDCYSHKFLPPFAPPGGWPKNFHYKPVDPNSLGWNPDACYIKKIKPVEVILTKKNYQPYADYAKDVQLQTQEVATKLIRKAIEKTGIKKVCVCGGYGMNILANSYYTEQFPDVEFYFEPLSIDSGISIGMAMYHYRKETGDTTIRTLKSLSFHGTKHDVSGHKGITTSIEDIAKLLYDNKSVAVYTGLSEAGQRALGNRSILFNALNADAKDLVNKIKKREWYRPFAAVVLEEDAGLYFDTVRTKRNRFMTQSFKVITNLIPGVTHVDNTCRVQTVSKEDGYLYELLLEFKKLSGHGILLNTSFNLAGKPLVETPRQAIETLNNSVLDYLWFEETKQLINKR